MFELIWDIASTGGLVAVGWWVRGKLGSNSSGSDLVRR